MSIPHSTFRIPRSDAPAASAAVSDAGDGEELTVLPDELRIVNTPASRATYRVVLPTRLARVVVLIGAEPPVHVAPVVPGDRRSLDLSRAALALYHG